MQTRVGITHHAMQQHFPNDRALIRANSRLVPSAPQSEWKLRSQQRSLLASLRFVLDLSIVVAVDRSLMRASPAHVAVNQSMIGSSG
jgi:hypothetical protein